MPKMISPAGEMGVSLRALDVSGDLIVVTGKFGTWDSKIYLNAFDVRSVLGLIPVWKIFLFVLRYPFMKKREGIYENLTLPVQQSENRGDS